MKDGPAEIPLTGGRTTAGIVRVGNTVRRPVAANADMVRRLLRHLESEGFTGSPRYIGKDSCGREVISFIEGYVPTELERHDIETLRAAALLIRQFHDLSAGFVASMAAPAKGHEIICHNDLSPCNFVFRNQVPLAIIDFDAAALGARVHDLAYAAWLWLDIGAPATGPREQRKRLAAFLDAYGAVEMAPLLNAMLSRQDMLAREGQKVGDDALTEWAIKCRKWTEQNLDSLLTPSSESGTNEHEPVANR